MATVENIHIGAGNMWIGGTAPTAGADPIDPTSSDLNAMTTGFAAPASGGTAVGFTNGPATLTYRPTYYMVETEQAFAEVITTPTAEETTLAFNALEATYQNIVVAMGQATAGVNAGTSNAIFVGGKPTVEPQVLTLCSRKRSGTGYYLLTMYQAYSNDGVALNFERRREMQIAVTVRGLADATRPEGDQLFQLVEYMANPA